MAVLKKSSCRFGENGSVTLEFGLALSALALVVVCGALLIALVGAKTELTAVAFEAARAEAVSEAGGRHLTGRVVSGFWPVASSVGKPDILNVEKDGLVAKVELTLPLSWGRSGIFPIGFTRLRAWGVAVR